MLRLRRCYFGCTRYKHYVKKARLFCTSHNNQYSVLTREFIYGCLYSKDKGYFNSENREVLHAPDEPIDFTSLWGEREFRRIVSDLYKDNAEAWLTPVEVFAPYYSNAIANYMLNASHLDEVLKVYEIGGGSGTNALSILNYIKGVAPHIYEKMDYTIIEISPVMANRQRHRVLSQHPNCTVVNADILTWSDQFPTTSDNCFFIAMEVLDNLPHDKVAIRNGKWYETVVVVKEYPDGCRDIEETGRPLQDQLIMQTLEHFGCDLPLKVQYKYDNQLAERFRSYLGYQDKVLNSMFIPTGAMQLLSTLRNSFPRHRLIAADFDSLPSPSLDRNSKIKPMYHPLSQTSTTSGPLNSANAPIVASKRKGVTMDHDTYLVEDGFADIFFGTDFHALKKAYCSVNQRNKQQVSVVKTSAFMQKFAEIKKTRTILGYNPLIDDYSNTSFILS